MFLNSVMNEGLAGMQQSQKKMLQAAEDIVRAGRSTDQESLNPTATPAAPRTNAGVAADDLPAAQTLEAAAQTARTGSNSRNSGDLVGALVEQKQQQLIFDASASVVKAASDSIGTLIDDMS